MADPMMDAQREQLMKEFRRELFDKMEVYRIAAMNTSLHKAIVQQQCLDFMTDLYRAALLAQVPRDEPQLVGCTWPDFSGNMCRNCGQGNDNHVPAVPRDALPSIEKKLK